MFSDKKYYFEEFVEATRAVHLREQLFEIFIEAMKSRGFDRINFSIARDDEVPVDAQGFGIISTYPADWQRYYIDREFVKIDPVLRCATSTFRPFKWRELERKVSLSRRQTSFLRQGEEAGLHNGLGIPFNGPRSQIAGIALATSSKTVGQTTSLDLISAHCNQFYSTYTPAGPP